MLLLLLNFFEYPLEFFIPLIVLFELLDLFGHPFSEPEGLIHKLWISWVEVMGIEKVVFLQWTQGIFDAHPTIFVQVVVHLCVFTPILVVARKLIDPILPLFFSTPLLILKLVPFFFYHLFYMLFILELNVCELYKVLFTTGTSSPSHLVHTDVGFQDAQTTAVLGELFLQLLFSHLIRTHGGLLKELLSSLFVLAKELLLDLMLVREMRLRLGIFRVIVLPRFGRFMIIKRISSTYKSIQAAYLARLQRI